MKKLLSVVLSVALVVTTVVTCFTFNANAEDTVTDYVKNGDFEKSFAVNDPNGPAKYSDSTYGWGAQVKASHGVHGTQQTTTADKHGGNQSFLVGAIWSENPVTYQAIVPAGKTVEVSFWAKKLHGSPKTTITGLSELNSGKTKNGTVLVEDCNFNINNTWQRFSKIVTLGTDNVGVELLFSTGADSCFYIDDLSIKELVATNAVVSTNGNTSFKQGGTATVSADSVVAGGSVTYTATPNEGFTFDGWYNGETKVSSDASFVYTANENTTLTANFTGTITEYVINGDFEKYFIMAAGKNAGDYDSSTYGWVAKLGGGDYPNGTKDYAKKDGNYGLNIAIAAWANNFVTYKALITPGLTYRISFDAKLGRKYDNANSTTAPKIGVYNHNNLTGNSFKSGSKLAEFTPSLTKEWTKVTKVVQADSDKNVLELDFCDATAGMFIDNFSIKPVDMIAVSAPATTLEGVDSDLGGTATADKAAAEAGEKVTYTAVANDRTDFEGWYVEGSKVSSEASYAVTVQKDYKITANFVYKSGVDYVLNGDFEKGFSMSSGKKPGDYDSSAYGWVVAHNICPANWGYSNRTKAEAAKDGSLGLSIATANWDNNSVSYKTAITAGLMYRISFDAKLGNTFNNEESTTAPKIGVYNHNNLTGNSFKSGSKLAEFTPSLTKEWTKVTKVVQADSDKNVLELDFCDATAGMFIDNFSIKEVALSGIKDVVVKTGDKVSNAAGCVSGPESGTVGSAVEFTATATEGGKFDGWYKDGALVSSEATISHKIGEAADYVAQFSFKDAATVDADSFEGDTSNWNGYLLDGAQLKFEIRKDGLARSGNSYLWGRLPWRTVARSFDVQPNTTYTVSFYYRVGALSGSNWVYGTWMEPKEAAQLSVYGGVRNGGEFHWKENSGGSTLDPDAYTSNTFSEKISTTDAFGKDAWKLYTFNIRTGAEDTTLDFGFRSEGWSEISVDDIVIAKADTFDNATTLEKAGEKAAAALEYQGAQIRTTGKQALRFLQYINKDVLGADKGNYEIVEYGSVVMKGEYLDNDSDLVIGYQGTYGGKLRKSLKAVAYSKDDSVNNVFEDNTDTIGFTAAIINIGVKNYASDYAARSYVIVKDKTTGETTTVYGTVDKSNILYIANALKDDATFGESMQKIIADYDAYLAENN